MVVCMYELLYCRSVYSSSNAAYATSLHKCVTYPEEMETEGDVFAPVQVARPQPPNSASLLQIPIPRLGVYPRVSGCRDTPSARPPSAVIDGVLAFRP